VPYTLTIRNPDVDAVVGAVSDDLSGVLDKASLVHESASSGSVVFNPSTDKLAWDGTLGASGTPGATVTIN
jgi:hypothetical protein